MQVQRLIQVYYMYFFSHWFLFKYCLKSKFKSVLALCNLACGQHDLLTGFGLRALLLTFMGSKRISREALFAFVLWSSRVYGAHCHPLQVILAHIEKHPTWAFTSCLKSLAIQINIERYLLFFTPGLCNSQILLHFPGMPDNLIVVLREM